MATGNKYTFQENQEIEGFIFLAEEGKDVNNYRKVRIKCKCGNIISVRVTQLTGSKKIKSCGCERIEKLKNKLISHNMVDSPEYASWESMIQRCTNPNRKEYKNYGGRGITVCEDWLSFENFYRDMGERPGKKYSIDRKDNEKGYSKENCKWSSRQEQERNKRNSVFVEYEGETMILADVAKLNGIHAITLRNRMKTGMTLEEAINKPIKYTRQ